MKKKIIVVTLEEIENELHIVNARLKLAKHSTDAQSIACAGKCIIVLLS